MSGICSKITQWGEEGGLGIQMKQGWPCTDNYEIWMVGTWEVVVLFSLFVNIFENLHTTKICKVKKIYSLKHYVSLICHQYINPQIQIS